MLDPSTSRPLRLLYVCTANVSRSPYAQIRTAEIFGDQVRAASAGIPGLPGREMDPAMEAELPFDDEEAHEHRSRRLSQEIIDHAELVLTMEFRHHMAVLERWPHADGRTFGLRQFVDAIGRVPVSGSAIQRIHQLREAASPNSMMWDIEDPYRRGTRAAQRCARQLDELVLAVGKGLGLSPDPEAL